MSYSTRRKSTLPTANPTPKKETHEDCDEEMEYWENEEVTTDDGEDDDWGPKKRKSPKKRDGQPSAKRARTGASDSASGMSKKARRTRQGKLSSIMDLPLDVLFEILGLVEPRDLLTLTMANKMLRSNLTARGAVSVWKSVLIRAGAPSCPSDVSHPAWVKLLFGGPRCYKCNTTNIHIIDYAIRRRLCRECRKKNLVAVRRFSHCFPDYDKDILELLPYTKLGGWSTRGSSQYYWKDDVYTVAKELGVFQKNVQLRAPNAKQKLEDYKATRRAYVKQIVESVPLYDAWALKTSRQVADDASRAHAERINEITKRLLALGHQNQDVDEVCQYMTGTKPLSDRGWAMIKAGLESEVNAAKARRLNREREARILLHQKMFKEVYRDYKKTLDPSQWADLPLFERLCSVTVFHDMLANDAGAPIGKTNFLNALVEHLPQIIPTLQQEVKNELVSKLKVSSFEAIVGAANASQAPPTADEAAVDVLDLAVTVLSCGNHQETVPLWGFDAIWQHKCSRPSYLITNALYREHAYYRYYPYGNNGTVWESGTGMAIKLMSLVEKDPATTTFKEMDQLDARFVCKAISNNHGHHKVFKVYNWRQAVMFGACRPQVQDSWRVLTGEETIACKTKENNTSVDNAACWTCAHCPEFLDAFTNNSIVTNHLKALHDVSEPIQPRDLFISPEVNPTFPDFGTLVVQDLAPPLQSRPMKSLPARNIICKMCPVPQGRMFEANGVRDHLKAKHQVMTPVQGQHWDRV